MSIDEEVVELGVAPNRDHPLQIDKPVLEPDAVTGSIAAAEPLDVRSLAIDRPGLGHIGRFGRLAAEDELRLADRQIVRFKRRVSGRTGSRDQAGEQCHGDEQCRPQVNGSSADAVSQRRPRQ